MTTLFEEAPAAAAGGVHILAIGVGKYPHLLGGAGELAADPLGLRQLTSPPASIKGFIDWCLAPEIAIGAPGFCNPKCRLASVEALVSAPTPMTIATPTGNVAVEAATRNSVQQAFQRWLPRVASHPDNIGVFYFCGHGLMVSEQYLLAEDFGANAAQPWANAFDISTTMRAMEREVRGALYFLIDACRIISTPVALTLGANPHALWPVNLSKPVSCRSTSFIQATGEGKQAFGATNAVSRFTEALLTALSGHSGVRRAGVPNWEVDGETLALAIRKLLEHRNRTATHQQVTDQRISGVSVPLLSIPTAPHVLVELDLTPEAQRAVATLYLTPKIGATLNHAGATGPFITKVPRGFYTVGAQPLAGAFLPIRYDDEDLVPPVYELVMKASP